MKSLRAKSITDIDTFLTNEGIVQLYNRKIGIKNISASPSVKFWSMIHETDGNIFLFKSPLVAESNFNIVNKLQQEFNGRVVISAENYPDFNAVKAVFQSKGFQMSKMYGCIKYNSKIYYYDNKDMIKGTIAKDIEGTQFIQIGNDKYPLMASVDFGNDLEGAAWWIDPSGKSYHVDTDTEGSGDTHVGWIWQNPKMLKKYYPKDLYKKATESCDHYTSHDEALYKIWDDMLRDGWVRVRKSDAMYTIVNYRGSMEDALRKSKDLLSEILDVDEEVELNNSDTQKEVFRSYEEIFASKIESKEGDNMPDIEKKLSFSDILRWK